MARKLRPATNDDMGRLAIAHARITEVCFLLHASGCPQSHKKATSLLKSVRGAMRHMERRIDAARRASQANRESQP